MTDETEVPPASRWHIDKTINISVVVGFGMTVMSGVWFAASMSARVDVLERRQASNDQILERMIRVEDEVKSLNSGLVRLERFFMGGRGQPAQ